MLYGMGMVVVFLVVLVYATRLLSSIVLRFFPEPEVPAHSAAGAVRSGAGAAPAPAALSPAGQADPKVIAAVVAAVHAHRQRAQQP
jgi:oxaloacetate decarboxylase gamma subunit